jgi:AcrR family transcriptional regulator
MTNRNRLLEGLAQSLREKGLQHTQIADIVRHARTSRRTFYECFADKESAFVELISETSVAILELVEMETDRDAPWDKQVDQAIDVYLGGLAEDPALTATVSRELPTLGERGANLQHEGIDRFAHLVVRMTSRPAMRRDGVEPVSLDAAVMLCGGIAELIARATHQGTPLLDVGETAKSVIKSVIQPSGAKRSPPSGPERGKSRA